MKTVLISILIFFFVGVAYSQHTQWAKNISGNKDQKGLLMTTDAAGNLYLAGNFEATVDFDPGTGTQELTSAGLSDIFLMKLDADGQFLWAKRIGGIDYEKANGMVIDASGNLLLCGYFYQTVDFDPNIGIQELTSLGDNDMFLLKLDSDGNYLSCTQIGGILSDFANNIALNSAGEILLTGQFEGTVDFDPGIGSNDLSSTAGSADVFVLKLDASANFLWAKSVGNSFWDAGFFIAADGSDNVYVFGVFGGTVDFDPGLAQLDLSAGGMLDLFMLKLDNGGNLLFAQNMGGDGNEFPTSVRFDSADNLYLTGYSDQLTDLDPGLGELLLTPVGGDDSFLAKYNSSGELIWGQTFGGPGSDYAFSSTFNSQNEIYLIGAFQNTVDFDPGTGVFELTSNGSSDIFVASFDTNGNFLDAGNMGADSSDFGYNIIIDQDDNMYLSGSFSNTVDLDWEIGELQLTSNGLDDIFVCKLSPQPAPPSPIIGADSLCEGSTVSFSVKPVSGADTYNWTLPSGLQLISGQGSDSISVLVGSGSGTLALSTSNTNGNSDTVYFSYTVNPLPVLTIDVNPGNTVAMGTLVTLTASGADSYLWNNGIQNGVAFTANETLFYTVIGEKDGCFTTDSVELVVMGIGIQEWVSESSIRIYPTLVSNQLYVDLPDELLKSSYEIHDNSGKLMLKGKLNEKHNEISFSGLNSGVYVIAVDKVRIRVVKRD